MRCALATWRRTQAPPALDDPLPPTCPLSTSTRRLPRRCWPPAQRRGVGARAPLVWGPHGPGGDPRSVLAALRTDPTRTATPSPALPPPSDISIGQRDLNLLFLGGALVGPLRTRPRPESVPRVLCWHTPRASTRLASTNASLAPAPASASAPTASAVPYKRLARLAVRAFYAGPCPPASYREGSELDGQRSRLGKVCMRHTCAARSKSSLRVHALGVRLRAHVAGLPELSVWAACMHAPCMHACMHACIHKRDFLHGKPPFISG
eukprot:353839-Chlamydomonas_euryale.AAC.5